MISTGKYQHFKGNYYHVLHIAKHSETEEYMVVYQPLYVSPDDKEGEPGIWVRPLSMFDETITREGKSFKRFAKVTEIP